MCMLNFIPCSDILLHDNNAQGTLSLAYAMLTIYSVHVQHRNSDAGDRKPSSIAIASSPGPVYITDTVVFLLCMLSICVTIKSALK
jgi:hypothetical protein